MFFKLLKKMSSLFSDELGTIIYLLSSIVIITILYDIVYMSIENVTSFSTMLYYNVVTASTVGYGDLSPQTALGKVLTLLYIPIVIALFAGIISVIGTIIYDNITKTNRGERPIDNDIDYLIIGGFRRKMDDLATELIAAKQRVALINTAYDQRPHLYKKHEILWIKGGARELKMINLEAVSNFIILCNDPSDPLTDAISIFTVEALTTELERGKRAIVEVVDHDTLSHHRNITFIKIMESKWIACEALNPGSTLHLRQLLDNNDPLTQINSLCQQDTTLSTLAQEQHSMVPIGVMNVEGNWRFFPENPHHPIQKGELVKCIYNRKHPLQEMEHPHNGQQILLIGSDQTRIERIMYNYKLDPRYTAAIIEHMTHETLRQTFCRHEPLTNPGSDIVLLADLSNPHSDELNFYLWKSLQNQSSTGKIIVEILNESTRCTLEERYEDRHNEFATYYESGLIVQELQDEGIIQLIETERTTFIDQLNHIIKTQMT